MTDSLAAIIETLTGAIAPMATGMKPPHTDEQAELLHDELMDLVYRIEDWLYEEDEHGDDADTHTFAVAKCTLGNMLFITSVKPLSLVRWGPSNVVPPVVIGGSGVVLSTFSRTSEVTYLSVC